MPISIAVTGLRPWIEFLIDRNLLPEAADQAIERATEALKAACPVRTGQTRASIGWAGSYPRYQIRAAETLRYLIMGTPAHVILPRFKSALWWPEILGGRPVAIVHHPGYRPRIPLDELRRLIEEAFQGMIEDQIRRRDP